MLTCWRLEHPLLCLIALFAIFYFSVSDMPSPTEFVETGSIETKARYDLPKEMSAGIGRIVTRWSYAEFNLQNLIYELTGVSDAVGRIALREPRLTDRLTMVLDLLEADDVELSGELLNEYKAIFRQAGELSSFRDLCVHGTWSRPKELKSWCVTNTRGKWEQDAHKHGLTGKKRIKPEGRMISPQVLQDVSDELEEFIERLIGLHVIVGIAYHASRKNLPQPTIL